MRINCDLVDLRLIINIIDTLSLTQGAARSYLSPPAASSRLKKIQASIGEPLFNRTSSGLTPTTVGEAVGRHARIILEQFRNMEDELLHELSELSQPIRVYSTPLSNYLIRGAIESFMVSHSDVNLDLDEKSSKEIFESLLERRVDIGILTVNEPFRDDRLDYFDLKKERLVLIIPNNHPLQKQKLIAFTQAVDYEFITPQKGSPFHRFIEDIARKENLSLQIRIQSQNFEMLCNLVSAGIGVAVIPESEALYYNDRFNYGILELDNNWAVRNLRVAVHKKTPKSSNVYEFLNWILK